MRAVCAGIVHAGPHAGPLSPPPLVYAFRPPWVPNDLVAANRVLETKGPLTHTHAEGRGDGSP